MTKMISLIFSLTIIGFGFTIASAADEDGPPKGRQHNLPYLPPTPPIKGPITWGSNKQQWRDKTIQLLKNKMAASNLSVRGTVEISLIVEQSGLVRDVKLARTSADSDDSGHVVSFVRTIKTLPTQDAGTFEHRKLLLTFSNSDLTDFSFTDMND